MEDIPDLSEAQCAAYDKLKKYLGLNAELIISQGQEVPHVRLKAFMRYETFLIVQVQDPLAASMPTRNISVPDSEPKAHPLNVNVKTFEAKEGEISHFGLSR